jgi:hypothetical protein
MPLQTTTGSSGSYKIEADGFDNMSDYSCIQLEDKLLNKTIDLTTQKTYSFQLNAEDDPDRFNINFSKNGDCKSLLTANNTTTDFENQVVILPTPEGNSIAFNLSEAANANITVTNVLGQTIVEGISITAQTQTVNIALPADFSGMYIIRVASPKATITKKFVRK